MPGLILCNRRCCFSADDTSLPAGAFLACHLLQLTGLISLLSVLALPSPRVSAPELGQPVQSLRNGTLLSPNFSCQGASLASALIIGFRLLLLLACCLIEAACALASSFSCCRCESDASGGEDDAERMMTPTATMGQSELRRFRRLGRRDWAVTRLVKIRLFLLALETAWHLLSLPALFLLLLPLSQRFSSSAGLTSLNACANRSVWVRLLAAVAAIDWTVAVLVAAILICLLRRLGCCGCHGWWQWRPLGRSNASRARQKELLHANHTADDGRSFDESLCAQKQHALLPPLPPLPQSSSATSRQVCCHLLRQTSFPSTQFGLADAAIRLTPLFADLDLVASDVAAGLVLLRRQQRQRQKLELSEGSKHVLDYMSGRPIYSATRFLNLANPSDRAEIDLALRCAKLTLAARACCHGNGSSTAVAVRRQLRRLGIGEAEFRLTHASRLFFSGFDATVRSAFVVVAPSHAEVASTSSMTDLIGDVAPIPLPGVADCGVEWLGHAGAVDLAVRLGEELARFRALDTATSFGISNGVGDVENAAEERHSADVTLTGHGVSGGAAVILTLLALARGETWPSRARVIAQSPPGGLLGREAAMLARRFATSVVIGRDAVARLGPAQASALRHRVRQLLAGCWAHRWSIILRHLIAVRRSSQCSRGRSAAQAGCCSDGYKPQQQQHQPLQAAITSLDNAADSESIAPSPLPALQLPGRVLHVVRARGTDGAPVFHAIRADGTDFDEVLASPSMLRDHSPGYAIFALAGVLSDYDRLLPSPRGSLGNLRPQAASPQPSAATSASVERRQLLFRSSNINENSCTAELNGSRNNIGKVNLGLTAAATSRSASPLVVDPSGTLVDNDVDSDEMSSSIMGGIVDCSGDSGSGGGFETAASASASALLSMMPHSHTMPAALMRNFGLPPSAAVAVNGPAPIATPESLSLASVASSSLSDLSSSGGVGGFRHAAQPAGRPLSDLFGYCYYVFPDEEAGRRRPFDDILPRPRVNFACIAAAMSTSTPPALLPSSSGCRPDVGSGGGNSTSSSCETITECIVAAPPAATAAAVAVTRVYDRGDAGPDDSESCSGGSGSDLGSAERTPRLLRSGASLRLLASSSSSLLLDEAEILKEAADDYEADHDNAEAESDDDSDDNPDASDSEEGRLYMTMDSDASGVSLQTVIAGNRGGDYV